MDKGFWGLIEEMAPSTPDGPIDWSAAAAEISEHLTRRGFDASPATVARMLDDAGTQNADWVWKVTREGVRFRFLTKK